MSEWTDPHDEPHATLAIQPLVVSGWAVLTQRSYSGRHGQLVLTAADEAGEILGCWAADDPDDPDWGVPFEEIAESCAHVAWHAAIGAPPSVDEHGDGET